MTVLAGHRRRDLAILLHRPSSEQNTYPMTPNGMTVEINGERRRLIALSAKETHRRRTCPKSDRASDRRGCARRRRCGRYGEGMKEKSKERRSRREATMKAGEKKEDSVTVERWARKKDEFDERGWLWQVVGAVSRCPYSVGLSIHRLRSVATRRQTKNIQS